MADTSPFCSPSTDKRPSSRRLNFIGTSRKSLLNLDESIRKSDKDITEDNTLHERPNRSSTTTTPPVRRTVPVRKGNSATDVKKPRGGGSPRGRGSSRRNTGIPLGPKRISKGAVDLPLKISIETPNIQRIRSQQSTKEDLLLRQKKVKNNYKNSSKTFFF